MRISIKTYIALFCASALLLQSALLSAERVRLERKRGVVNKAFQEMLNEQVSSFRGGVGKIELGRSAGIRKDCTSDIFVSPDTVYVVLDSKKTRSRAEFYIDHPHDSFKDILFQSLIKDDSGSTLSVDKKSGGFKISTRGNKLNIEVKQSGKASDCSFDLSKAVLVAGETE